MLHTDAALASSTVALLHNVCALAVMCKAPRAGKVKTRLSPPLTLEQAAHLNICFLKDTAENIAVVIKQEQEHAAGIVCYTPVGDEAAFDGLLPQNFSLLPQRGDGFGERLLCAVQDLLAYGFGSLCLIDSDSPTLPTAALQAAVRALQRPGDRVVLGGSQDGGYYLIGLKQAHARVFENITWSTGHVLAQTIERAAEIGIPVELLSTWYDVDDAATLAQLKTELLDGARISTVEAGYAAPNTCAYLRKLEGAAATEQDALQVAL